MPLTRLISALAHSLECISSSSPTALKWQAMSVSKMMSDRETRGERLCS